MIRAYQALQYGWFPKGKQHAIKTYGKHEGAKLIGALNYETGQITYQEKGSYDAQTFEGFLENLLGKYPKGKIVMILDNSRIHHASRIKQFLDKHKRLKLQYLPKYSPNLNLIEGLWKWLKRDVINNVFHSNIAEIRANVKAFMKLLNKKLDVVIDRLCVSL